MIRFIALLLILSTTACGTITRGTRQAFTVTSEPSNAEAKLSTGEVCITPCTLQKKRKDSFTVTVGKEGYKPSYASVISQIAGAGAATMAGNIFVGGIIGVAIDAGTGAAMELIPNPLHIILDQEK